MHVLYVVHGFPPETWAGTEIYTLELARAMAARGARVTILARTAGDGCEPAARPDFSVYEDELQGLRVLRLVNRLRYEDLRGTFDEPRAVRAFREVLLRERPDVVHFQHLLHLSVGLVQQARDFNLPTVIHCHDYWALCPRVQLIRPDGERCEAGRGAGCFACVRGEASDGSSIEALEELGKQHPLELRALGEAYRDALQAGAGTLPETPDFARSLEAAGLSSWDGIHELFDRHVEVPAAFASADLLVSPSRFLRERLLASGHFDPQRFLYSDNGLRTDLIQALEKRPDPARVRFGFVGSIVWYKGLGVLVEAMRVLAGRNAVLHVHGPFDPEGDAHHAELARQAGDNVVFHGRFDNARVSEVYRELDVLVVPSLWFENSPITIHEAYLAHTPVVASDIGGMAEYVRNGVDGLTFRVGDAEALAQTLARFLDEPELLGALSHDWMEVKSVEQDASDTEARYRELIARPRERKPLLYYELRGQEAVRTSGEAELQGPDLLLLRPGASASYELELAGGGPRIVELELATLGGEPGLVLSGRARLAGRTRRIAPAAPARSAAGSEGDQRHTRMLRWRLPPGPAELRVEAREPWWRGGRGSYLRIARVVVREDLGAGGRAG